MEINEKALTDFKKEEEQQATQEQQTGNKLTTPQAPSVDLSQIKPLVHRLHHLVIDILGYEAEDELVKGLDDDAIKIIEYYAPNVINENSLFISYFGTLGLVLMSSKKKNTSQNENKLEYKGEEKQNVQYASNEKTNNQGA